MRVLTPGADTANELFDISSEDAVIAISFWRIYNDAILALEHARLRSATTVAITDSASNELAQRGDITLVVPAEGASFFPSLAAPIVAVEAICAELAAIDPERTRSRIERAEEQWSRFDILRRRTTKR
jgi:DNA-binding MurR/RpiR family transcriptional regulator